GDREIDLVLGRHRALEGDPVGLGGDMADAVLDEIESLLLLERGSQILGAAEQPRLALLADAALEDRLHEDRAMAVDERLDLLLAGIGAEPLRSREPGELQQLCAVQHARDLHRVLASSLGTGPSGGDPTRETLSRSCRVNDPLPLRERRYLPRGLACQRAAPVAQEALALRLVEIGEKLGTDADRPRHFPRGEEPRSAPR